MQTQENLNNLKLLQYSMLITQSCLSVEKPAALTIVRRNVINEMNYPGTEPRSIKTISIVLQIFSRRSSLDLQRTA